MVILGIDPGLAHTGWGIVETRGSECRARAYGCITTTADEPIDMRLGRIYNQIVEVIDKFHQKHFLLRAFTLDKTLNLLFLLHMLAVLLLSLVLKQVLRLENILQCR